MRSHPLLSLLALLAFLALLAALIPSPDAAPPPAVGPFAHRGYYLTLTRTPTFGLDAWRETVDAVREDGGNLVVLWVAGGFKSKKFPDTWGHNADHANVRADFVRELIAHAHRKGVRVLLGFTPFGYDGVNRMSLARPEWAATGPDGRPAKPFGIHSWGRNLCPARADVQAFMLEYAAEMYLDFYPTADGLLVESSDYAACHCPDCGPRFFDHEFRFVRAVSDAVWAANPDAAVVVYPHYFTGADAPGLGVRGVRRPFDRRWAVFFTPHSARPDADLTRQARGAVWSDDSPALHTPVEIRAAARTAARLGCSGWVPSFEAFGYVPTEPEDGQRYLVGRRQWPLGFGWLPPGTPPYTELPARVNRVAYREYSRDPDLSDEAFRAALGDALFGAAATAEAVDDALALQRVLVTGRTWWQAAPAADPERVRAMATAGQLTAERRAEIRAAVERVRDIERRYRGRGGAFAALHRPAAWLADQWAGDAGRLIAR